MEKPEVVRKPTRFSKLTIEILTAVTIFALFLISIVAIGVVSHNNQTKTPASTAVKPLDTTNKPIESTTESQQPSPTSPNSNTNNPTKPTNSTSSTSSTNPTAGQENTNTTQPTTAPATTPTPPAPLNWSYSGTEAQTCYTISNGCPMGINTLLVTYNLYATNGTPTLKSCTAFGFMSQGNGDAPLSYKQNAPAITTINSPTQCSVYFNAQYYGIYYVYTTLTINEQGLHGQTVSNITTVAGFKP